MKRAIGQQSFLRTEPADPAALLARARALAGRTLAQVAAEVGRALPDEPKRAKGFIGELLEEALGASASSRSLPDFPHLGIELKSIPVAADGTPRESTFVCTLPMAVLARTPWEESPAHHKLTHVLWVPVEAADGPLGPRRIGAALLWRPSPAQEALLQADWELFGALVRRGDGDGIDARHGEALQLRPKGADADELSWDEDAEGEPIRAKRRGLYLRPTFTRALLARALIV